MVVVRVVLVLVVVAVVAFAALSLWSRRGGPAGGLSEGRLLPCGPKPNCVSSEKDATRRVDPLPLTVGGSGDPRPIERLRRVVEALPRARVVEVTDDYLHAEVRTALFRFVDDLELRLDREARVVQVRSASRVGYSDRGENRRRVERLRRLLREQG